MMKTKFLLSAIVLPLAFAACTDDVLVEAGNGQLANIESRATLGDITFVAGDVDSRLTTDGNGKWTWEDTDKFSAHLIDGKEAWAADTALVTNYIYSKTAEGYTTTSQMVEGLYWFFAPANENKVDRHMMTFELPVVQNFDAEDPAATLLAQNVFFSPVYKMEAKNNEANVNVPLTMYNWYATALIPLKNIGSETLEINKIIIETSNALVVKGKIDPAEIADKFQLVYKDGEWTDKTNKNGVSTNAEKPLELDYINGTGIASSKIFMVECPMSLEEGETYTVKMLMPFGNAGTVTVKVVLSDERVITLTQANSVKFNHHAQKAVFGVSNGKAVVKSIKASMAKENIALNYVMNNDELLDLLNSNSDDIRINKVGDWALNAASIKAISSYSGTVNFSNVDMVELESAADEAITLKNLVNDFTLVSGKLNFAGVEGAATGEGVLNWSEANGYYTSNDNTNLNLHNIVVEGGELNLTGTAKKVLNIISLSNEGGKVTLSNAVKAWGGIANEAGELIFAKDNTVDYSLVNGCDDAAATLKVNSGVTLTLNYDAEGATGAEANLPKNALVNHYNGTIDVDGKILGAAGQLILNEGGVMDIDGQITATIKNKTIKATISEVEYIKTGNITVSKSVSEIENGGLVTTEAGAKLISVKDYTTTAGTAEVQTVGKINNTAKVSVANNGTQEVYYVFEAADVDAFEDVDYKLYSINTVHMTGEFTMDRAFGSTLVDADGKPNTSAQAALWTNRLQYVKKMYFKDGSSLNVEGALTANFSIPYLVFEGTVEINGFSNEKSVLTMDGYYKSENVWYNEVHFEAGCNVSVNNITIGVNEDTSEKKERIVVTTNGKYVAGTTNTLAKLNMNGARLYLNNDENNGILMFSETEADGRILVAKDETSEIKNDEYNAPVVQ